MSWPAWSPTSSSTPATTWPTPRRCPPSCRRSATCSSVPGVFVFGSNDYFGPRPKNPLNYLTNPSTASHGQPLPWQDLRAAFTERGWLDMTHTRREFEVAGLHIAAAGVDDPHLARDRYEAIAGPAEPDRQPAAGADPFAGAAGAGPLRRRRLPAGDGRPHPRRPAVPAVLRRPRHQLRPGPVAGQGRVALGCQHAAARLRGHRHVAVRAGAVLLPARGHVADVDCRTDRGAGRRHPGGAVPPERFGRGERRGRSMRDSQPATLSGWTTRSG